VRRTLVLLVVLATAGALIAFTARTPSSHGAVAASCSKASLHLVKSGQLTIGTDNPAYPPWYAGPSKGTWKLGNPLNGKGYESAVAYAIAKKLGFSRSQVQWVYTPFAKAFAPGAKSFDFDINQISYSPARARQVSFSVSYYNVQQAVAVKKGKPITRVRSRRGLRPYKLGAQLGTTSYQYIVKYIKPSQQPAVFPTNNAAVQALKNGQIDGLVVDYPTAYYVTTVQVPGSKILGRLPLGPGGEHLGVVLQKGNPLLSCVNKAINGLRTSGTLKRLQEQWLSKAIGGAPILK
jgi:polar amino acid transport system substrate-binding protein